MKCAVVIVAGLAAAARGDVRQGTPLAAARTPALDRLVKEGQIGVTYLLPPQAAPDFCTAALATLGYDPRGLRFGAGPAAALANRVPVGRDAWVVRCELVSCRDGAVVDPQGGGIRDREAAALIERVAEACADLPLELRPLRAGRGLCTLRGAAPTAPLTTDPYSAARAASAATPRGRGPLRALLERSQGVLAEHEINQVRTDLGELPVNALWPWGEGDWRPSVRFRDRFGAGGVMIAGDDSIRGLARMVGLLAPRVEGADGTCETDVAAKGAAAVAAVNDADVVAVHVHAPRLAADRGDDEGAVSALEAVDGHVLAPLRARLEAESAYRMLVVGDPDGQGAATPFALSGTRIAPGGEERLHPAAAERSGLVFEAGWEMLEYVLRGARRASIQR